MKILMVTMSLDIGGAETHIVELSRELVRRGHEVITASDGGVYVEELEQSGIRHVKIPLRDKNPVHMLRARSMLKKLIQTERPDLVHAHARIPGFITGLVHRTVPFSFVTTAHWVFHVTPLNRRLTNWGTYTVAVSDDIKQYLIDEYDLPPEQISTTINGIDMKKFSPDLSGEGICREFGLDRSKPVVSYVSRMDESRALAARQLIAAAPDIAAKVPGVQFLIAGGGDVLEEVSAQAEEVNQRLGRRCVVMTGARTDINEIIAAGDIFVGVSRAALEAMSEAKPVIVAGNEGYIGIFREEQLEAGQKTNFCCRGCGESSKELLARDVVDLLTKSTEERRQMGEYGRDVVRTYYSAARMADDYLAVYEKAAGRRRDVLLSGYYGFGNAGDEAILSSIYENIQSLHRNIGVSVLISHPEQSAGRYPFRMVNRFHPFQVLKAVRRCDVLISGGGSLLQDRTSTKSILYYIAVMKLANWFRKPVVMYANGIGPVDRAKNRKRVKKIAQKAGLITLRDSNSAEELRGMGVKGKELHVTADPVFTYDRHRAYRDAAQTAGLLNEYGIPADRGFVGVSLREWGGSEPDFDEKMARICDHIYETSGLNIVFIVMQTPNDGEISERVKAKMKSPAYIVQEIESTAQFMGLTGCAEWILCMRLHTLIFAANTGVPALGLIYDPKVRDYLHMLGMPSMGNVGQLDLSKALRAADDMIEHRAQYRRDMEQTTEMLRGRAQENTRLLGDFLDQLS